ncbi:hypothetical protein R1flu_005225 [Riccia fluitans]|uniref:DUF7781 domain-containing protein n=1 Tax=Riccia fluitans TaxID=41844 RepID=A0ABD1YSK2_9MARC
MPSETCHFAAPIATNSRCEWAFYFVFFRLVETSYFGGWGGGAVGYRVSLVTSSRPEVENSNFSTLIFLGRNIDDLSRGEKSISMAVRWPWKPWNLKLCLGKLGQIGGSPVLLGKTADLYEFECRRRLESRNTRRYQRQDSKTNNTFLNVLKERVQAVLDAQQSSSPRHSSTGNVSDPLSPQFHEAPTSSHQHASLHNQSRELLKVINSEQILRPTKGDRKWMLICEPKPGDLRLLTKKLPIGPLLNIQVGIGHDWINHTIGWKWKVTTSLGGDRVSQIRHKTLFPICPGIDFRVGWNAEYVLPDLHGFWLIPVLKMPLVIFKSSPLSSKVLGSYPMDVTPCQP